MPIHRVSTGDVPFWFMSESFFCDTFQKVKVLREL